MTNVENERYPDKYKSPHFQISTRQRKTGLLSNVDLDLCDRSVLYRTRATKVDRHVVMWAIRH